jgi:hypothetical protein
MEIMIKNNFSLLIFLTISLTATHAQSTYYVDSQNGNDKNSGIKTTQPWATLEKVNSITFKPGDKILFKAATVYKGTLAPKGSGTGSSPIIINQYGSGNKPRIDGEGRSNATMLLENIEYWEVNNLEITNTGTDRQPRRTGVTIKAENFGDCHHILLKDLVIHDVNGSLVKSQGGGSGIYWSNSGDKVLTRFMDLRIENCHLYKCDRNGITSRGYTNRDRWHPSLGVVIKGNLLEQIPGDGIVPIGCDGALIEHNIMRDSPDILSHEEAAAGIWPWSSDNTTIQYNEVSGHKAKWDGQGFDSDWNCKNTVIQYNYSHDNAGGFLLVCNNGANINTSSNQGTTGTIVRYNVSVNDGLRPYPTERAGYFSPVFHISGPCKDTYIYNNIIFVKQKPLREIDKTILKMDNWGGPWPENTIFKNNIFYSLDSAQFAFGQDTGTAFSHNVFYGIFKNLPEDKNALFENPMFETITKTSSGLDSLSVFRLKPASPCIDSGTPANTHSIKDFFGNEVNPATVDRGIHEFLIK